MMEMPNLLLRYLISLLGCTITAKNVIPPLVPCAIEVDGLHDRFELEDLFFFVHPFALIPKFIDFCCFLLIFMLQIPKFLLFF